MNQKSNAVNKKYYDELNIFRGLIIIWVTYGHASDIGNDVFSVLHSYAYSFHMPAFFLLSGLLFYTKIINANCLKNKGTYILDRAKRLIVPYLFFSVISYILKAIFERYAYNELGENPIVSILLCYENPNGGLWFLYTLFFISVLGILLSNITVYGLLALSCALKIFILLNPIDTKVILVPLVCNYAIYFFAGALIRQYYDKISDNIVLFFKLKKASAALLTLAFLSISAALFYIGNYKLENDFFDILTATTGIISWYLLSVAISQTVKLKRGVSVLGDYGMDIYMIGYYIQIAGRVILRTILNTPEYIWLPIIFVTGLILPIFISKYIVRKFKITRALMLGDFKKR